MRFPARPERNHTKTLPCWFRNRMDLTSQPTMMHQTIRRTFVSLAAIAAFCLSAVSGRSQVLASAGFTYTNSFDSLGTVTNSWVDNSNLPGWYASQTIGVLGGIRPGSGTSTAGALYSFGVAGVQPATDRALGRAGFGRTLPINSLAPGATQLISDANVPDTGFGS